MNGQRIVAGSWALAFGIIAWSSFHQNKGMPEPRRLIKTSIVWTMLSVVSEPAPQAAGIMSFALLLGLFMLETGNLGLVSPAQAAPARQEAQAQTAAISNLGALTTGAQFL